MKHLIYKHTCNINNKAYIGQTSRTLEMRLQEHIKDAENGSLTHFHKALRKYGPENFTSEILEDDIIICSVIENKKTLGSIKEISYIEKFNTYENGYNMTIGGDEPPSMFGKTHSIETKLKISNSHKGKIHSQTHVENNSKAQTGKVHSEETKLKISNKSKLQIHTDKRKSEASDRMKGTGNPNFGVIRTTEYRENMSKIKMGVKHPPYEEVCCPHCDKKGKINAMKRWHFDNCKLFTRKSSVSQCTLIQTSSDTMKMY